MLILVVNVALLYGIYHLVRDTYKDGGIIWATITLVAYTGLYYLGWQIW
jgi:hypothetical protein